MADKMVFPIGFDLKTAVDKAAEEWDSTYAKKLETQLQKRALGVKLHFSTKDFDNLEEVKKRLAQLRVEPLTPETQKQIKDLVRELKELARIMEKVSSFKGIELPELQRAKAAKINNEIAQSAEKLRLQQERVRQAQERLTLAQKRAELQAYGTNGAYRKQTSYLSSLIKKMTVYASVGAIGNFLTKIREVTAEFELQKVSLGAIIQDQTMANQLFSEIKTFALKSPVSIMDLTKYTKQLAAYKIGVDDLFETTKKLTDVSVGLGVSMDRVVLAYGQVRATGHLRASEIRQFTEMGVPIVEELAAKLSQMNGELVTSAQVMDMVSKRAISFDMVKQVFDDMTSAGGIFYNMQEKQGNTLYGMWAKLGDAASVMYDEIGNTGMVNWAMKGLIDLTTMLMRNWGKVATIAITLGAAYAMIAIRTKLVTISTRNATLAQREHAAATERLTLAEKKYAAQKNLTNLMMKTSAKLSRLAAVDYYFAAKATNAWTAASLRLRGALRSLGAAAAGNWVTLLLTGVSMLVEWLILAANHADKLNNKLADIKAEGLRAAAESVVNFESLANRAVNAADGSREQRKAMDELINTYGNIIPYENLTIENLKQMRNEYDKLPENIRKTSSAYGELTDMVEAYNRKMQYQNEQNAINEDFAPKEKERRAKLRDMMTDYGLLLGDGGFTKVSQATTVKLFSELDNITKTVTDKNKAILKAVEAVWNDFDLGPMRDENGRYTESFLNLADAVRTLDKHEFEGQGTMMDYVEALINKNQALNASQSEYDKDIAKMNEYATVTENTKKAIQELGEVKADSEGSYSEYLENEKSKIQEIYNGIASIIGLENENIINAYNGFVKQFNQGKIDYATLLDELLKLPLSAKARQEIQNIQKMYRELAPTDQTVVTFDNKFKALAQTMEVSMFKVQRNMMKQGQSLEEHRKVIVGEIDDINKKILTLVATKALMAAQGFDTTDIEAQLKKEQELLAFYEKYLTFIPSFEKEKKKSGGSKQDPRLQNLKEEISLVQKLYQEYKQLEKQEGANKATADMNRMAKDSIAMLSKKYGISLPKTATDVVSALEILYGKMAQLPKKVFPALDKDLKELRWTIEKVDIDDSQANIEKSLKDLADRISRTKTAKEFYEKILSQTGDKELAMNLSLHIYGENGKDLFYNTYEEIQQLFQDNNIVTAINFDTETIDYNELVRLAEWYLNLGKISDETYKKILKMRDDDRKDMAKTVEGWLKATEKAKTYSEKLLDLRRTTQTEIDRISKAESEGKITSDFANSQREGYLRKEAEEIAKLQYEAFKDSPMYVQMFGDLDHASTSMLRNMRDRLEQLKGQWKNLDPQQLKEMQSRLKEIDERLTQRNPFKALVSGLKAYQKLRKNGDLNGNKSSKEADKKLEESANKRLEAEEEYLRLLKEEGAESENTIKAKERYDQAQSDEKSAQKAKEAWQDVSITIGSATDLILDGLGAIGDIANGVADIMETVGADEEDVTYWRTIGDSIGEITAGLQDVVQSVLKGDLMGVITGVITAIPKMFIGFFNLFHAGRIRKANKEIKYQQELLDQLEYTYSRLEKAAEKAFGGDYINNFKQQQKNLQAQQLAYEKQLEAEKSKGKKADKEKIKEYEEKIRDVKDEIADMQGAIAEKMLGTDLTSAARDFAQAWLDAYKEFDKTADAMSEKFHEMIENMVAEGALAKVMERALQPMFDMIDNMNGEDFYDETFWQNVVDKAEQGAKDADYGAQTMMGFLEQAGISIRDLGGDLTGISRDIAGASEESINGLAAAENTRNFYIAQMLVEVQGIHGLLQGNTPTTDNTEAVQWKDWQGNVMTNLNSLNTHAAGILAECKRSADRCEQIANDIHRTIDYGGGNARIRVRV